MKKTLISTAALAVLAGLLVGAGIGTARGQAGGSQAEAAHKVGLIDMAHVFKNYKKFEVLREDLKTKIEQSDAKAKQMAQQMKDLQAQLESKTLTPGSPDYVKIEKQMIGLKADFEAFRTGAQRDFLREESQIYKTVYLEVSDAVQKYAQYYKYTLIMRFNRDGLEAASEPSDVLQRMNRQVVFHREEDDITDSVLDFLNSRYQKAGAGGRAAPPVRTGNPGPKPAGTNRN